MVCCFDVYFADDNVHDCRFAADRGQLAVNRYRCAVSTTGFVFQRVLTTCNRATIDLATCNRATIDLATIDLATCYVPPDHPTSRRRIWLLTVFSIL